MKFTCDGRVKCQKQGEQVSTGKSKVFPQGQFGKMTFFGGRLFLCALSACLTFLCAYDIIMSYKYRDSCIFYVSREIFAGEKPPRSPYICFFDSFDALRNPL